MILIVGLGNPGKKYEQNRHNVGFMAVDELARADSTFDWKEKFSSAFAKGHALSLLKPQTFMNLSGDAVQPCAAFLKVGPECLLVVHDELDVPFGEVRIKVGGGHAGHNGLRSIINRLGTPDFVRVRIGIGRPPPDFQGDVAAYVLGNFTPPEKSELPNVLARAVTMVRSIMKDGTPAAMNAHNRTK